MAQQAFNFLSKQAKSALKGKFEKLLDDPATTYLRNIAFCADRKSKVTSIEQLMDIETVHEILETKSLLQIKRIVEK